MSSLLPINVIRLAERQRSWRWERAGIRHYEFENAQGKHSVYARITGKPKLILLHGYGGSALVQWFDVARFLKDEYDVIIPDLLCSGTSTVADGDYSVQAQVRHIKSILDQLSINEKVILCGNSYGGVVSAYFADEHPELVSRLVLYDAPLMHFTIQHANEVAVKCGVTGIRELLSPPGPREMKIGLSIIYHKMPYFPDFVYDQMFEGPLTGQREEQLKLLDYVIANEDYYQKKRFSFPMPVFLIWGEFDILVPLTTAQGIMAENNIPDDHLYIIPNAAHAANMEHPKYFTKVLRTFLTR